MNSTYFGLLAEFEVAEIPLKDICEKYLSVDIKAANQLARQKKLGFPAYRCGTQKSEWLVCATEFAKYLDQKKQLAKKEWQTMNNQAA